MDSSIWYIISIIILILLSAFFSCAEAALLTVNKITLKNLIYEKVKKAQKILDLKENPTKFISALLIGNNIVNILAASLSTSLLIKLTGPKIGVLLSTSILTIIIIVFGEMLPKSIGISSSLKISLFAYYPLLFFIYLFFPFIFILTSINSFFLKIFHIQNKDISIITCQQELETVINESREEGIIEKEEQAIINSVFEFRDTLVYEIMVPRVDMICLEINDGIDNYMDLVTKTGHSRIPVYEDTIDNIVGILYTKDVMVNLSHSSSNNILIKDMLRKTEFVPDTKNVDELFKEMRERKLHMTIVVDEYGGTAGLVTLEDILEEIVGEIQDEYDKEEPFIKPLENGTFEIAGNCSMNDLNELMNYDFPSEEYDTVSGFLLSLFGHIPTISEKTTYNNFQFTVNQIKKRRILKVLVERL